MYCERAIVGGDGHVQMAQLAESTDRETENHMGVQDSLSGCPFPVKREAYNLL